MSAPAAPVDNRGPTEFHRILTDYKKGELRDFKDNYPLTTVITLVVFAVLGIFSVMNIFSPTAIISGALLLTLDAYLAMSIGKDTKEFWKVFKQSMSEVKAHLFTAPQKAEG